MLQCLLPPSVAVVETRDDVDPSTLHTDEAAAVARAVPARQREFATGRACARAALAQIGQPAGPLIRGAEGEPMWPSGVVGSITHCVRYRAAAVARRRDILALGIDAEPHLPMPDSLTWFGEGHELPAATGVHWDRLAFSALEAAAKAWWSMTGGWVDLARSRAAVMPDGTFVAHLCKTDAAAPWAAMGRWSVADGLLFTAVVVERRRVAIPPRS